MQQRLIELSQKDSIRSSILEDKQSHLQPLREKALDVLQLLRSPENSDEEYKYLNIKSILRLSYTPYLSDFEQTLPGKYKPFLEGNNRIVFINGCYSKENSKFDEQDGIKVTFLNKLEKNDVEELLSLVNNDLYCETKTWFDWLNLGWLSQTGVLIEVAKDFDFKDLVNIIYIQTEKSDQKILFPRIILKQGENSRFRVSETYLGNDNIDYITNAVSDFHLLKGSRLEHFRIQYEGDRSNHIGSTHYSLEKESYLHSFNLNAGAKFHRANINTIFKGVEANATLDGLSLLNNEQVADNHTVLFHQSGHCKSSQTYKSILNHKSRNIFNGKIKVERDAQKTDSNLLNKNLILDNESRADTKPELEIDADDVKCAHGATVGQLNADELFYFQSRGISRQNALNHLMHAFAQDVINRAEHELIQKKLKLILDNYFQDIHCLSTDEEHDYAIT